MVKVSRARSNGFQWERYLLVVALLVVVLMLLSRMSDDGHSSLTLPSPQMRGNSDVNTDITAKSKSDNKYQCPYSTIDDLTEEERNPVVGSRHMVTPPAGGPLTLVCCQTTKGVFNTLVHEKWAPNGAKRFLDMVRINYFESKVPLMRCIQNFICQFGLNTDPQLSRKYRPTLEDDPNWLPEGKDNRRNEQDVLRFARGYMAYAGGGKNSRNNQFIISLKDNPTLAGGSPWEVPWGEIVGAHSFETWSKIYTGYGEKGPPQGKLMNRGMDDEMKKEFPLLDYVTGCNILDER